MKSKRPFTLEYVIDATKDNMVKSVDFSINRTIQRLEEFDEDPKGQKRIHDTLKRLTEIKDHINGY